jgi:molecular chaperone DnaK
VIYQTEKSLKDVGDKATGEEQSKVNEAIEELRRALEGDDLDAIKAGTEKVSESFYPIAAKIYQQTAQEGGSAGPEGGAGKEADDAGASFVDADYEVVDDDEGDGQ